MAEPGGGFYNPQSNASLGVDGKVAAPAGQGTGRAGHGQGIILGNLYIEIIFSFRGGRV